MVDLGYFAMPLHPKERTYKDVLEENRQAIILADQLGFSEAWIGEHQTSISEPITDPFLFLATVINQTNHIRLGTAVLNLPYHHPVKLGMQIAMFDQLSNGRAMLGIGPGGLVSDSEIFDLEHKNAYKMMIECVDIMQILWSQDAPIDFQGEFWNVTLKANVDKSIGLGTMPKPFQAPFPPIAYAMRSPKSGASKLLAERDWIPISGNFIPSRSVKTQWEDYCVQRENLGKNPDPENWRAARSILVAETNSQANEYLSQNSGGFRHYFHYLRTLETMRVNANASLKEKEALITNKVNESLEDQIIAGNEDTVLQKLVAFRDEVGPFGTLLMTGHDWDNQHLWKSSMQRLSRQVMPRFRQHATSTDPSY